MPAAPLPSDTLDLLDGPVRRATAAGVRSRDAILGEIREGLYVTELMGMDAPTARIDGMTVAGL